MFSSQCFFSKEEYLYCHVHPVCLIMHLGGSSIATTIVLEESPNLVFLFCYKEPCIFSCNCTHYIILFTMYTSILSVCLGSNENVLLLLDKEFC